MSKRPTEMGLANRTGIGMSPKAAKDVTEFAAERVQAMSSPSAKKNGAAKTANELRVELAKQAGTVGTMPPPASLKGVAKTAIDKLKGKEPTVLLDKLGERLAFERSGVRLYEALMVKLEAAGARAGGPTREELAEFRDEELRHFGVVKRAIEQLGGDPTTVTPSADVVGVEASGLFQVLGDPRTSLDECLGAVLTAELVDNDAWDLLARLARESGHEDLAEEFETALTEETNHLVNVRRWVEAGTFESAGIELEEQPSA